MAKMNFKLLLVILSIVFMQSNIYANPGKDLFRAIEYGDLEMLKNALKNGVSIESRNYRQETPLHYAVRQNKFNFVRILVEMKANVNALNRYKRSPLHIAARYAGPKIINFLIKHKTSINQLDQRGDSPLYLAVTGRKIRNVKALLKQGADPNLKNRYNNRPIIDAVKRNQLELVQLLLKNKAKISVKDRYQKTPLHYASAYTNLKMVKLLMNHKADLNAKDRYGYTPIFMAFRRNKKEIAKYLLEFKPELSSKERYYHETILHLAVKNGWNRLSLILLQKISPLAADKRGLTPLHLAVKKNQADLARVLIQKGAKLSVKDKNGRTPLYMSAYYNARNAAEVLIKAGADFKTKDKNNTSMIDTAVAYDSVDVLKLLKEKGISLQKKDAEGYTLLHTSAHAGALRVTEFLIKNGLNVNSASKTGWTPLHAAAYRGKIDVVELLLEKGAQKKVFDKRGRTPWQVTRKAAIKELIKNWGKSKNAPTIRIEIISSRMNDLFSAQYKSYREKPIGTIKVLNQTGQVIQKIKTQVMVKEYMDFPSESPVLLNLKDQKSSEVQLYAVFNNKILDITEDTPLNAQIHIRFLVAGKEYSVSKNQSFKLYNRNAMTWDETRKIASFVTPKDPAVILFSRKTIQKLKQNRVGYFNKKFQFALQLFNAMGLYGLSYVPDPKTPYKRLSQLKTAVDYIQYPRDILRYKAGDCDDLSVLYCSLLENLGIDTAMVTVPGHIFMMFNTGVPAQKRLAIANKKDYLVEHRGTIWIPVETTLVGKSFLRAWQSGARKFKHFQSKKKLEIVEVQDAWKKYSPVTLRHSNWEPRQKLFKKIRQQVVNEINRLSSFQLKTRLAIWTKRLKQKPGSHKIINKIGVIYAMYGKYQKAKDYFGKALKEKPNYFSPYNNLGNIALLKNDFTRALVYFKKAKTLRPDSARLRINLALIYKKMNKNNELKREYRVAKALNEKLGKQYAYLLSQGAARASEENEESNVLWND